MKINILFNTENMKMKTALDINNKKISGLLSEIKKKAIEIIGEDIVKIILYGSYARNSYDEESDLDLMFLVDENEKTIKKYESKFMDIIFELSLKYDILLSVILKNEKQFNKYLDILPFYMNVHNEGIEIYGKKTERSL